MAAVAKRLPSTSAIALAAVLALRHRSSPALDIHRIHGFAQAIDRCGIAGVGGPSTRPAPSDLATGLGQKLARALRNRRCGRWHDVSCIPLPYAPWISAGHAPPQKAPRHTGADPAGLDYGLRVSDKAGTDDGNRRAMNFGFLFFTLFGLIVPVVGVIWILRARDR